MSVRERLERRGGGTGAEAEAQDRKKRKGLFTGLCERACEDRQELTLHRLGAALLIGECSCVPCFLVLNQPSRCTTAVDGPSTAVLCNIGPQGPKITS